MKTTNFNVSRHAANRIRQRAICPMLLDLLLEFGSCEPSGDGSSKFFFDKVARRRINSYAGPLAGLLNEHLDVYVVVGENEKVITAAHLTERIRRH